MIQELINHAAKFWIVFTVVGVIIVGVWDWFATPGLWEDDDEKL